MTKLNPEHSRYPGTDIEIDYTDVVTRGKASTLWEVVDTEYPDRVRLSRLGSYGETNTWASVADLNYLHRTQFTGATTCQNLLDMQEMVRELAASVRDDARYVQRIDEDTVNVADVLHRKVSKLRQAVNTHRRILADTYGIKDEK